MRGITSTLAVSAAALLLALPGRAVDAPTPDLSFSFTNSTAPSIGSLSWQWNNPDNAVYVDSLRTESDGNPSKAVTINGDCHPGVGYNWPAEFSVMSYIKVTDAPDKGTVVSFGNNCFLLKQNATTMRFGTAGTYVDATAADLSTGWHLVVAKRTASGLSIQIDDGTAVTGRTAIEVGGGFQIGTRWTGPSDDGTAIQATNLYIDELAIYNSVLTEEQVAALVEAYPAAVPPTYTADLSTSAETTVNYSALTWDVGSAPGANARVIIKTPAAGITITMDQASSAFALLTVQGSGKLTLVPGSGLTGTALSTNELVVETDVDVSAITSSLGSVTVAADKTLTTGANTTMTGVPTGSATSKIKVVGSDLTAIPNNVLAMTGIVEIEPTITLSGDAAKLSFNTAQTLTYSANVNAPRLVVGDSGSANATITQVGGTITLSSTATACNSTTASAILLGHWNTTTTYNLQAGTLSAPGGALCLGWDGTTTLNVGAATGNAALVDVYALKSGDRYNTASVTINPTGTLQVGEGGIGLGSHSAKSMTLAGGTLLATATTSANIAHANGLNVTAASTIAAAPSATLTINKVSGSGNLTLGTAEQTGSVVISDVSAYTGTATASAGTLDLHSARFGGTLPTFAVARGATLILPAGKEGAIAVPDGATLTLVLSSTQRVSGYATTVTSGKVTFKKEGSDGALVEITDDDGTIENGTFTPSLNTWTAKTAEEGGSYTWSNADNWSKKRVPAAGDSVKISVPAEGTTLTLGSAVTVANVSIAGEGTLTLAGEALTVSDTVVVSANTTAVKDKFLAGAIQIDDGKALTVSTDTAIANVDQFDANNALALPALTGTGTLIKEGTGVLGLFNRSAEPTIQVKAGTLHVRSNPTTAMKLAVEDGATVNFTAWSTSFTNSLNTFALKGGSSFILGNGLNANSPQSIAGAMTIAAATDEKPAKIYGSAFGPVTLNMPISGTGTVEFADGGTFPGNSTFACDQLVTVSGVISGGIKVKVTDQPNVVVFSGANDYSGGTDIAAGSTLQVGNATALSTSGTISGAGIINVPGVLPSLASERSRFADTWTGRVKISGTNKGAIPIGNYGPTVEFAGASGYLDPPRGIIFKQNIILSGNGWTSQNGNEGKTFIFQGTLSGDGLLKITSKPDNGHFYKFEGDVSGFTGPVTVENNHVIFFANGASDSITFTENKGKIVINKPVTVGGTWTANNGIEVKANGSLSGTGTIASALTFNNGATLDVTNGALTAQAVTIAEGATVTVTGATASTTTILTCSSPAAVAAKLTGAPAGYKFAATETAVVLAKAGNYTVGGQAYETLEKALAAIAKEPHHSGTIVIDAGAPDEITLTKQILLDDASAYIGIDLGGKTLKVNSASKDEAVFSKTPTKSGATSSGAIWVRQGSLTLYNGTIETTGRVVTVGAYNTSGKKVLDDDTASLLLPVVADKTVATLKSTGEFGVVAFEGAHIVTSGNISTTAADCCAISGNGLKYNTAHITIEGGEITSAKDIAIYNPQYGSLTITGGTITGKTAVYVKGGDFSVGDGAQEAQTTISGGTLIGNGDKVAYTPYGNGAYATGDALVIDNDNRYAPLTVTITGGQFFSENAEPIASYSNVSTDVLTGFVSGGKFNKAIAGSLCADGKCCVKAYPLDGFAPWAIVDLPAISGGESGEVVITTPEAKDVIGKIIAADTSLPTSVEVIAGTKSGAALPPAEVADALAIFGSSVTTTANEGSKLTITVSYDFGISEVYQDGSNIVVKAKVQKSNETNETNATVATISNGVTLTLVDGDGVPLEGGVKTLNAATQEVDFSIPVEKIAGKTFKVKATK